MGVVLSGRPVTQRALSLKALVRRLHAKKGTEMSLDELRSMLAIAAYLSSFAALLTAVTAYFFFAIDSRYGKLNDALSVIQLVAMLPLAAAALTLVPEAGRRLALVAAGIGGVGMLVGAILQAMLVVGAASFERTFSAVLTAGGAIGVWLVASNALLAGTPALPTCLPALGITAGAGYLLTLIAFRILGQDHPFSYVAAALALLGYSAWSVWLGRLAELERILT